MPPGAPLPYFCPSSPSKPNPNCWARKVSSRAESSTRAESEENRRIGCDVIGMTNLPEAKLAREAEIALATLAMVTDYDCWKDEEVNVQAVIGHLQANAALARKIVAHAVAAVPAVPEWPEHQALEAAVLTPQEFWPSERIEELRPILGRFLP